MSRILQINLSPGGVPKYPVPAAEVTPLGLAGDGHAHPRFHGGPNQALLLIANEAIQDVSAQGYPLYPGALGENITMTGVDHRLLRVGQRYRLGMVLIELTKVRVPCATLDVYGPGIQAAIYDKEVKAGNPASLKWGLSGFYARVLMAGSIQTGDIIALVDQVV